jgi:hypothetical protein
MVLLASNYDQSRFLKAADLQGEKKFRIKLVTEEEIGIGKDKERKLVVWFTNDARGLVLNKTNIRTLAGAFGDDCAGWANKIIITFPTMAEFRGEMKPALRVRIPPPKQATTAGNGQMDDGIPESLRRVPKGQEKIKQPDPADNDVDDELNDELNI